MFRRTTSNWSMPLLSMGLLLFAACKPSYPLCDKDEHCLEHGEVCVNGHCQECREDTQCSARYPNEQRVCTDGRCEVKAECHLDTDCKTAGEGFVCRANHCVPECTQDADCGAGRRCNAQKCVAECAQNTDCGAGLICENGACVAGEPGFEHVSGQCKPLHPGSGVYLQLDMVHFEFNQSDLTAEARDALSQVVTCLKEAPDSLHLVVEGHCDERGTQEYNLALGERRAQTVLKYLRTMGVASNRMILRSKGENEPLCMEQTEECYAQNRRVQFIQQLSH